MRFSFLILNFKYFPNLEIYVHVIISGIISIIIICMPSATLARGASTILWLYRMIPTWRQILWWVAGHAAVSMAAPYLSSKLDAAMYFINVFFKCMLLVPYSPARSLQRKLRAYLPSSITSELDEMPPLSPDVVSAAWITQVLHEQCEIPDRAVCTNVKAHLFDSGKTSYNARLFLEWKQHVEGAANGAPVSILPKSVVLKMTRSDVDGRVINHVFVRRNVNQIIPSPSSSIILVY